MKNEVIKPYGTALWLFNKTNLTFKQIADFCGINMLEIAAIANGSLQNSVNDPVAIGQLTLEEIARCEKDQVSTPKLSSLPIDTSFGLKIRVKKYVPLARRRDKIGVIVWFAKTHPTVKRPKVAKLVGSTKKTVDAIFDGTYAKLSTIVPKDPVQSGFCNYAGLSEITGVQYDNAQK